MAVKTPPGPSNGLNVVARAVSDLMTDRVASFSGAAGPTQVSQPLRRYLVHLNDVTDVNFLAKAVPIGWRYLIVGPGPAAIADVKELPSGAPGFDSLIHGELADRLAKAAEFAEQRYGNHAEDFEARILEIPAVHMSALWLHGPQDIFVPLVGGDPNSPLPPQEDTGFVLRAWHAAQAKQSAGRKGATMPNQPDQSELQQAIDGLVKAALQLNQTAQQLARMMTASSTQAALSVAPSPVAGGPAGPVQAAASFTVRTGHRYRATLSLSGFEQLASNDMVAGKLRDAGFTNVVVSGSGGTRIAEGTWSGPDTTGQLDSHIGNVVEIAAAPAGGAAMLAAAASFTVRTGHRYRATLSLSGFEQLASNDMVAGKLRDAGFTNVVVSGSGGTRIAEGTWSGPDTTGQLDSHIGNVVEIAAAPAGGAAMLAAAASFTVRTGHRYRATLSLSGFEQLASNDMVAGKLRDAGFTNVVVSGSGGTRIAEGTWSGPDTTGQLDSHIVNVVEIPVAAGGNFA